MTMPICGRNIEQLSFKEFKWVYKMIQFWKIAEQFFKS